RGDGRQYHVGLMPADLITLPHFSTSVTTKASNSFAVKTSGVVATSASRAFRAGLASPAFSSWFSLSMISGGVPRVVPTPAQALASYPGILSLMLGTPGNMLERAPQMPSARNAPDWTGGRDVVETSMPTCTCPPMRSVIIGAPPRYGTWIILTPAIILNSSPAICEVEPVPYEASVILPGSALASAI